MQGRYGADRYSRFLLFLAAALALLNLFVFKNTVTTLLVIAIVIYGYYRVFSKNITARSRENAAYLRKVGSLSRLKRQIFGKDGYKYFSCRKCNTELRVPKGKGKIKVRCPKCGDTSIKRT